MSISPVSIISKVNVSFLCLLLLTSCSSVTDPTEADDKKEVKEEIGQETFIKEWLIAAIEEYFANDETNMDKIATKEFSEYVSDAINIQYDGMSFEEFAAKWKGKYEVSEDKIPQGFLIEVQDYNKIEVEQCNFVKKSGENWVFRTTLVDKTFNMKITHDIEVIAYDTGFLIYNY